MIVPSYWAEGRARARFGNRQFTARRFGWSDASQAEAQRHADARAEEALAALVAGGNVDRREPKVPYNGADGVPIREEILLRQADAVVTRNSYGAACLNTANVLIVDIDDRWDLGPAWYGASIGTCLSIALGIWASRGFSNLLILAVIAVILGVLLPGALDRVLDALHGGAEPRAHRRVSRFSARHPEWRVHLYRTPAGHRVIATHRTFDPLEDAVAQCFKELRADPEYVRMCSRQKCFRARLTPKPWRIGVEGHLRPRPGVWPVREERLPDRRRWIIEYERRADGYAACRFVGSLGSGAEDPVATEVRRLHDELSRAASGLPIA